MPCKPINPFDVVAATIDALLLDWMPGAALNDRWLILSDSPERLEGIPSPAVLYRCSIPIPASGYVDLRMFVWHVSAIPAVPRNLRLALHIQTPGLQGGSFENHEFITTPTPQGPQPTGLCVARGQRFQTLDPHPVLSGGLPANTTVGIQLRSLGEGDFYGAVHQMRVLGPVNSTLYV